ncbi:class I adenylate-forming enzyme family protein [Gimesia alba]|uniref:class I adenylate-forming enzyme family protein n=1 Tax=Gimesia alba TaxID=2527973 RepID=UPI0018D8904A|nr:class I adenylate-forming enzyme family protein [Gimesia alba]
MPDSGTSSCHAESTSTNLADLFSEIAEKRASSLAVSTASTSWSYHSLLTAVHRIAQQLRNSPGFQPGNRVLLLTPNSVEYIAAFYGILMAQGVVVPLAINLESGTFEKILKSTNATQVITTPQVIKRRPDLQQLQNTDSPGDEHRDSDCVLSAHSNNIPTDLAAIFFTAGSSGTPKGVMLSHSNLISNAQSIQEYLEFDASERPLCVLPFHHAFGNSVLQSHLLLGAHLVLDGNTTFPESIIEALNQHQCTSLSAVPDLFRILLERTSFGQTETPSLKYMSVAGGALEHSLSVDISRSISPARFFVMYGQTEATARLAYVPPEQLANVSAGCIGQAIPQVTLEVVDESGQPVEPATVGELRAQGPNLMLGYWGDPASTRERIRGGWLYTGDLATTDETGWIFIKGRRNSLVKISGYRVHPADLEEFAMRSFPIAQAVAIPFESKNVGTRLALYIKPAVNEPELSVSEMITVCRKNLPRQMVPDHIHIVNNFPLNHAMKVDRQRLSQLMKDIEKNQQLLKQ